ncbi:MAG: biotin/lipoyl-binding protein [Aliidongia sp.]
MPLPYRPRLSPSKSLILLALIAVTVTACNKNEAQQQQARQKPDVEVVLLHPQPVSLTTELPGRLSPFRVAEVRPQVSGVILKRLFTEGDSVKEGQQLYQIDPAPMRRVWPAHGRAC